MVLHKYTKAKHGLSYLRNGLLRFAPLREFNDPFEMRPHLDSLGTPEQEQATLRELEEESEEYRALTPEEKAEGLRYVQTRGLEIFRSRMASDLESLGILCLVNNCHDDLLMWAHYADSHKGCVLEFDSTHEWFQREHGRNSHDLMGILQEVKYEPSRPKVSLLSLGRDHLLTKAKCWEYERERRILLNLHDCITQPCEGNEGKEVNGLFPVPHEALTNIYLGVDVNPAVRDQFLGALPGGHPAGIFQFKLHEQEYALIAQQVN